MNWIGLIVLGAFAAFAASLGAAAGAAPAPSPFDKPLSTERVPLPRDPDNPKGRPKVSCFRFARFVVKEVDLGEVGADQLSIIPLAGAGAGVRCQRANVAGERVVAPTDWSGYYQGVKGDYVVFSSGDGWEGGMGFALYDARNGRMVFDDAYKTAIHSLQAGPAGLTMRYVRVYRAKCSLRGDAAGCWRQIKLDTGLTAPAPPDCMAAYAREARRTPKLAEEVRKDPTVIDYAVTVSVHADAKTIAPVTGKAAACRPAE